MSKEIVDQVEQIARGLEPVSDLPDGLMMALEDLAVRTSNIYKVACRVTSRKRVMVRDENVATQMFLTAQEAVANAVKHGACTRIGIRLSERAGVVELVVSSDGRPFPKQLREN